MAGAGWARRLHAALAVLVLLFGPAALAAPCAAVATSCPGEECVGATCHGCASMESGPGPGLQDANALTPASAGCSCGKAPADRSPAVVAIVRRGTELPLAGGALPARDADGPTEPTFRGLSGRGFGPPPGPAEPLHIRNCVLRV